MKAKDIMTKDVITVTPETTIDEVARLFVEQRISGAPVVDERGKLIGVISEGDLVYQQKPVDEPYFFSFLGGLVQVDKKHFLDEMLKVAAYQVKELMNTKTITADLDDEVTTIASMMINKGINRVPVVDEVYRVVGIITRHDVIKHIYL